MAGRTIAIVHAGEDTPIDEGYVPLRYGRLALELQSRGDDVIRIGPTFSHFRKAQRTAGVYRSDEGTHILVPTCSYQSSFDPKRARYFVQLGRGAVRELRARRVDAVVLGVPPPGIVTACRLAIGSTTPILADVRDLWPEAFAVGRRKQFMAAAKIGGTALSQDLRAADAITAVTQPMLDWAPDIPAKQHVVPIGMQPRSLVPSQLPAPADSLQVCFLSNHSHGFDFLPVFDGWQRFHSSLTPAEAEAAPSMAFIGCEPTSQAELDAVSSDPTIRFLGRMQPDEIAPALSAFDIGMAPASPEWEHSLGNKIFDYLGAGLFVLHSIDPAAIESIESRGLSERCDRNADAWHAAFCAAHARRAELRGTRKERIDQADAAFGRSATAGAMIDLIDQMLG